MTTFTERRNKKTNRPSWDGMLKRVIGRYCWLNKPSDKFAKSPTDAVYTVTLEWPANSPEALQLKDELEAMVEAGFAALTADMPAGKVKKLKRINPLKVQEDKEGNETGMLQMRCKMRAYRVDEKTDEAIFQPLPLVGADRQPFKDTVYSGARLNIKLNMAPYLMESSGEVGLTPYIVAVQVIENGSPTHDALAGFEDETDGDFEKPVGTPVVGTGTQGVNPF